MLPKLTEGSKVNFPDTKHTNVIREGVLRRKHETAGKVDVEYTTNQGTVTKTVTIPVNVVTPVKQPKYRRLKFNETFVDDLTEVLYVWKSQGQAEPCGDQPLVDAKKKEQECKQAEANKRQEDLQAAKAREKAKQEELKKQQEEFLHSEAVAERLSRSKVNKVAEPFGSKKKNRRKNTKNVEEALIAQGVKLDVPLSELSTKE